MDRRLSAHLGLVTLSLLAMVVARTAQGKPFLLQENELFPDKEDVPNQDLLLKLLLNMRRPSGLELELANKLEELDQMEKLKEQLLQGKSAEAPFTVQSLSSSHPNKRACFWKYCV
ncbi:urotensin-2B [Ambystoma mexicanum]|uniref:urotensin-2B n=1 Tax=Ambystoma mexicanum TaxID=8296 RepID=UPI0037E8A03E